MTPAEHRLVFREALAALETAHARLTADPSDDIAWARWCGAVEVVRALHEPIVQRSAERARKAGR